LLLSFEYSLEADPYSCGEIHPAWIASGKSVWLTQYPAIAGHPAIVFLYEIDEPHWAVIIWKGWLVP
jgi:hypothetical protein